MQPQVQQERISPPIWGDARICVAVLDGKADLSHACFHGAGVRVLPAPAAGDDLAADAMVDHGTHVASILFGQPGTDVDGLVPNCSGLVIPIFNGKTSSVSQLDLARAIDLAVDEGAHVINISGGQLTDAGEADVWLHNAISRCTARNVLVVAAAGNDGCACLHVPAALPNVLAVGALDRRDGPMDFSNWGDGYGRSGLMAPGNQILGAKAGGGTVRANGTSFATPLVSGAAALLLSLQVQRGQQPDPLGIRQLLLDTALPCEGADAIASRCLAGRLNLPGAFDALTGSADMTHAMTTSTETAISPQCACQDSESQDGDSIQATVAEPEPAFSFSSAHPIGQAARMAGPVMDDSRLAAQADIANGNGSALRAVRSAPVSRAGTILPSQSPDEVAAAKGMVFAIGVLGYDFGTEARRDTFKQLMPPIDRETGRPSTTDDPLTTFPANPYDARQMVDYLEQHLSEARSLIWTLNIDLTPVYVIEPAGPFAVEVYDELRKLLDGEVSAETDGKYIERVSMPGLLTGRTVKLFSGQVVPVIEPQNKRGIFGWHTNVLVDRAVNAVRSDTGQDLGVHVRDALQDFLNRVYYDLRNLGKTSQERALNFGVTNAFQATQAFSRALEELMQLDSITVDKSPFCRMDSDCWDIKLKFFDPQNNQKAKRIIRYTIDVSDLIPVVLGEPRTWTQAN